MSTHEKSSELVEPSRRTATPGRAVRLDSDGSTPNQAAAPERRDSSVISVEVHRRGVGEPQRWAEGACT